MTRGNNMNTQFPSRKIGSVLHHLVPNVGSILIMLAVLFIHDVRAAELNAGASPNIISYQGKLTTAAGLPVNQGMGLIFRLYNVQSGGTALWTEVHTGTNIVPVNNGLFNLLLGSITPIPTNVWNNPTVYLGVQVEGDSTELSPREVVGAVPFAMQTTSLTIPDGSITTSKIADGAITSQKVSPTYWHLTDPVNQEWTTNVSSEYVEVPGFEFSLTPETDGVVFADLEISLNHTTQNTVMNCGIFVNSVNGPAAKSGVYLTSTSAEQACVTSFVYPVEAGQTYRFFAAIYSNNSGTMIVHKRSFSYLSGIFWGQS